MDGAEGPLHQGDPVCLWVCLFMFMCMGSFPREFRDDKCLQRSHPSASHTTPFPRANLRKGYSDSGEYPQNSNITTRT